MPSQFDLSMVAAAPAFNATFGQPVVYTTADGQSTTLLALWKWADMAWQQDSSLRTARNAMVRVPTGSIPAITRGARFTFEGSDFEIVREATRNAAFEQYDLQEIITVERHASPDSVRRSI